MNAVFYLYLAGPITDISYGNCTDWRTYVSSKLPPSIRAISPMRGKDYLKNEKSVKASYEDIPLSSGKGMTGGTALTQKGRTPYLSIFWARKKFPSAR